MAVSIQRPRWKLEIATGDREPYPVWLELHAYGRRYRFVERDEAERELDKLSRSQPHAALRISPV
jgi:hypothetical protein